MYWHQCLKCTNSDAACIRESFSEQLQTQTWQVSVRRTVGPTDMNSIPQEVLDHILHHLLCT